MKNLAMVVAIAALFVSCGAPSATAQCKELSTLTCKRLFECYSSAEKMATGFIQVAGSTETECISKLNANNCASISDTNPCSDSSKKYDPSKGAACIDDFRKASCETIKLGTVPLGNCNATCG
jgi:hypothetical protein